MSTIAGLRYFEYGLLGITASGVIVDWGYLPMPSSRLWNEINVFLEWIETTYGDQYIFAKPQSYEWHVLFPKDITNKHLMLFKLRWNSEVTLENL